MSQEIWLLSLTISLIMNFNCATDFVAFGNLPNEFLLTDDTPKDHLVGKVQAPLGSSITFPSTSTAGGLHTQQWQFQILRPHKMPGQLFRIDSDTGELYSATVIDRELMCPEHDNSECTLTFQVTAQSKDTLGVPHFIDVKVFIVDRNDHTPEFPDPGFINLSVPESTEVGSRFPLPLARDPDARHYAVSAYVAEPEMPTEWAIVTEAITGEVDGYLYSEGSPPTSPISKITGLYLKLQKPLDHETKWKFSFKIRALDGSDENDLAPIGSRKDILQVYIYVEDINDNGPIFRPQGTSYSSDRSKTRLSNWMVTYTVTVPESKWIKEPILKLIADDLDGPAHSKVGYFFEPSTGKQVQEYFTLNPHKGFLFLRKPLDYELQAEYSFRVIATDMPEDNLRGSALHIPTSQTSSSIHTATAQVVISVIDTNDEAPEIEVDFISSDPNISPPMTTKYAEIDENATPPQFIASIQATDRDAGLSGQVKCSQQPVTKSNSQGSILWPVTTSTTSLNSTNSPFQLDEIRRENGRVQYRLLTREPLDREDAESGGAYRQVKIICTDLGRPPKTSSTFVNIRIRDKNDNEPQINWRRPIDFVHGVKAMEKEVSLFIYENAPVGSLVTRLNATDLDEGENGRISFSFVPEDSRSGAVNPLSLFQINEKTGDITTRVEIDREAYDPPLSSVTLRVKVSDNGFPRKSAMQELKIAVRDENDNGPQFHRSVYQFHVMENLPAGYAIGEILVTDKDEGEIKLNFGMQTYGPLPFTIWQSPFHGGDEKGAYAMARFILNTTRPLDREVEHSFKFTLLATDGSGEQGRSRSGTVTATVEVIVENENDNNPIIIFPQKQNKTFYLSQREKKNFELLTINANDKDPSENPHIFELTKGISNLQSTNYSGQNDTKRVNESPLVSEFLDIEPTTGIVFLTRDMRAEDKGVHVFKVQVTDAGIPPRSSSITFFVLVDDSPSRSALQGSNVPVSRVNAKPEANVDLQISKESSSTTIANPLSSRKAGSGARVKQKPRVAGDLMVLFALGLVFLLLIATLGLVGYLRYWKKQTRLNQANGNRGSLLFTNQVHRGGGTCLKEIRVPASKQQEQWLCTSDGSILSFSPHSQMLSDSEQLKNHFIPPDDTTGNIYYKAKSDALRTAKEATDNVATYSSLTPISSVVLKPNVMQGCDGYIHPDLQLAYYAQNVHILGNHTKDRAILIPNRTAMDKNTFRNVTDLKLQHQQHQQNDVHVIPPVAWDWQSRSDSSLKQEDLVLMSPAEERRSGADVSTFCPPYA